MHHGAGVVLGTQVVDLVQVVLQEVELHPALDVGPVDDDVSVPVRPALLVPEPGGVHQLVDDDPGVDTARAQTDLRYIKYSYWSSSYITALSLVQSFSSDACASSLMS